MKLQSDKMKREVQRPWVALCRRRARFVKSLNPTKVTMEKAVSANLKALELYCEYVSFPMDINSQMGSVRSNESRVRVGGFCVLLALLGLKSASGIATMAYKGLDFNTLHPIFNMAITAEYILAFVWGYYKLIKHRVTFVTTLQEVVRSQKAVTKKRFAHLFLWIFPASVISYTQVGNLIMSSDLDWVTQTRYQFHMLFEMMGAETSGWAYNAATAFSIVLDTVVFAGVSGMANLLVYSHMSFIEVWTDKMAILVGKLKQAKREDFEALWDETMQQTIFLQLFNQSHKETVFVAKLGAMFLPSICLASLLVFKMTNPLIVFVVMYNGFVAPIGYAMLYQKAYHVKELLDEAQNVIAEVGSKQKLPVFAKEAKAMLCNGIWVGSFRTIERESMFIFADFIANQVITIVLAVKG